MWNIESDWLGIAKPPVVMAKGLSSVWMKTSAKQ
jgi:hypothetical protein